MAASSWRLAALLARSMNWMLLTLGSAVVIIRAFAAEILQSLLGSDFGRESAVVPPDLCGGYINESMVHVQYGVIQAPCCPNLTAKFHPLQLPLHSLIVW